MIEGKFETSEAPIDEKLLARGVEFVKKWLEKEINEGKSAHLIEVGEDGKRYPLLDPDALTTNEEGRSVLKLAGEYSSLLEKNFGEDWEGELEKLREAISLKKEGGKPENVPELNNIENLISKLEELDKQLKGLGSLNFQANLVREGLINLICSILLILNLAESFGIFSFKKDSKKN